MKKIILLAACAAAISAHAFPTYEPFTEYAPLIALSSSNSIDLATSGLSVTNGAVVDNWLDLGFSATGELAAGQDVQVMNAGASSPFTAAIIASACPPNYPGSPGPITCFAVLPQTPNTAVGNSALLQFSRVVTRPPAGSAPQAIWVSYLIDVTAADGDNGTPGRYAGFLAQSNTVAEPSAQYPAWSNFFNSFINANSGAPPYLSYGIRSDQGSKPYMGPCDDYTSSEQLDDISSSFTTKSLGLVTYNTAAFVVGQIVLSPAGSGLPDSNTFWVSPAVDNQSGESPPAATFGGPDSNAFLDSNYYIDPNATVGFLHDVDGFFLQSRPATPVNGTTIGTYGTTYIANLIIGTTWSYVTGGPEFTNQPANAVADYGSNVTLSAAAIAAGTTNVTYQWQHIYGGTTNNVSNGSGGAGNGGTAVVSGATSSSMTLTGITNGDTGTYQVVAKAAGTTGYTLTSATATVTAVLPGPVNITANPQPVTVNYDATVTISASVQTGSSPVYYAWYKGATMLVNGLQSDGSTAFGAQATNSNNSFTATLTLSNVSYLDIGNYSLSASNFNDFTNSTAATLTVNDPYIAVEPPGGLPLEVATGATTNIPITAYGTGLTYQWQWTNGSGVNPNESGDISGTTSSNLTISPAQPVDSGTYDVVVSGASGQSVTSTPTTVDVGAAPYITTQPSSVFQYLQQGGTDTWTVAAIGVAPLIYQWCEGSTNNPVAGATNATFDLVIATNLGTNFLTNTYFCSVSNVYGASNSSSVEVIVEPPSSAYVSAVVADGPVAFLRLDEGPNNGTGNDGTVAYDTVGAHNGFYSNAVLQVAGYSTNGLDTDDYAAEFGQIPDLTEAGQLVDNYVGGINGINFGSAIGSNNAFSVEAWVYLNANTNTGGIVTHVNPPFGRTQFALDTGGSGHALQFSYGINESVTNRVSATGPVPALTNWYYVVGVLNLSTSSNVSIYVNGKLSATTAIAANDGVQSFSQPIIIGAEQSYTNADNLDYDEQLNGSIANVALYNYALTSNQIANHYAQAHGVGPSFLSAPTNTIAEQGQTNAAIFSASVAGSRTLEYQWQFDGTDIPGATTSVLAISNVVATNAGTYTLVVSNNYGTNSASALLIFYSGSPTVLAGPQSRVETVGDHLAFTVSVVGSVPISYQWQFDGTNINGATTTAIGLTNIVVGNSGTYSVVCANSSGTNTSSATLTVTTNLQSLSANNLVVARVGDGIEPLNSTSANTLYLDQFTPAGAYSNTIMIPDNVASTALTVAGGSPKAQYESVLTLSANNYFLNFGGYNTLYSPATSVGGSNVFRAIGAVNAYGYYQMALAADDFYDGTGGFNSVFSSDGLDQFWTAGTGTGGGIDYLDASTYTNNEPIPVLFGSTSGTRVVDIIANIGYLAYTDAGADPAGLWAQTELPIPTSTNGTPAPISVIADVAANPSPDDFAFSPDGGTIYLCDDNTTNNGGGIQRYDYNNGYVYSYTLGTGANSTAGASCLQVDFSASANWGPGQTGAIIYATTAVASGNSLIKVVDNGNPANTLPTVTVLDTANPNEILRGVRFGPSPGATVPVAIVSNPQPQTVYIGGTAVFSVVAENNGPFTYQWQLNSSTLANGNSIPGSGAVVSGAQTASLTISSADLAANGGNYSVVVNNQSGGSPATSSSALLTVSSVMPVSITSYPAALEYMTNGGKAVFAVGATGGGTLAYQWYGPCGVLSGVTDPCGSGAVIAGATTSALTISGVGLADSGSYYVTVTNSDSSTNTSAAPSVLTVVNAPKFAANSPLTGLGGASPQLNFSGTAGTTYRVWGSTNLALTPITSTWTLLGSGTFSGGADSFAISPTNRYTFYVITQP